MKLNAATELHSGKLVFEFSKMHPFAPGQPMAGLSQHNNGTGKVLSNIIGFAATSLQPNSSTSEYAGLLAIKEYQGKQE